MPDDVLEHHDRIVDDEADREREGHQRQVVEAEPEQVHHREGGDQRHRQGQAGNDRRRQVAEEQEDHQHDEDDREHQRELHVVHGVANRQRLVGADVELGRGRHLFEERRQHPLDLVHDRDHVGARLALHRQVDAAVALVPRHLLVDLDAVVDVRNLVETDRVAVAVGDDALPEGRGPHQLPVRLQDERVVVAVDGAGREIDVGIGDRGRHLVDPDRVGGQLLRVHVDAHRVLHRRVDADGGNTAHHRQALGQDGLGELVEHGQGQRLRAEHEVQHALLRRIHLLIGGRRRHLRREPGLGDRGLDVLGGRVDVAAQVELQRDARQPLLAGRGHGVQTRDAGQLFLERQRDRRGHRLGARPGHRRLHRDDGEIDVGEIAHRQLLVGHRAEDHGAQHQERRGDRPRDEERRDVHRVPPTSALSLTETVVPAVRRSWPSVTTTSPGFSPSRMTVPPSTVRSTTTLR